MQVRGCHQLDMYNKQSSRTLRALAPVVPKVRLLMPLLVWAWLGTRGSTCACPVTL